MTADKILEKMFSEESACSYCLLDDECPHGMTCYSGEPIEPFCAAHADNPGKLATHIDYESYAEENGIDVDEKEMEE